MEYFLYVKAALDYIEGHLSQEIRPAVVAAAACFSLSHFHTVFRAAVGMPLAAYIRKRRLCHAAKDLAETDSQVLDIALRYGFESHEAFTRAFHREFGCSPSAFRRAGHAMDSGVIVPGIFGPMPPRNERMVSERGIELEKGNGYEIIHGVPEVSYFTKACEVTPFPSSLRACLKAMGQEISYVELVAASGAAFRLMWNTESWDGGNVDILCFLPDSLGPLRRACRAAGRGMALLLREGDARVTAGKEGAPQGARFGGKREFVSLVRREIDAGRPLVGFGIIGPPEACVIAGYREEGEVLLGWNFFQAMPEFAGGIEKTEEGYFARRDWFEHEHTIMLMAIGEAGPLPDPRILAGETLRLAVEVLSPRRVGSRAGGLDAFDAWAAAMGREGEFPPGAPLHQLMERMMCMADALTMIGEGRWCAHAWTELAAKALPHAARPIGKAGSAFKAAHDMSWKIWALLGGIGMGEKQARALAEPGIRSSCIRLIAQAKEKDRVALEALQEASKSL